MKLRYIANVAFITNCLIMAGCATPKAAGSGGDSNIVQLTRFWQPNLLYLLASPHPRLYVEVDAVEGCEPSETTLAKLRDFLATYCKKPGGTEIIRSDVIPIKDAQGKASSALVHKYLNGPPEKGGDAAPAFMYVLFYDSALFGRPAMTGAGQPATNTRSDADERKNNPHVDFLPYPAIIFINARYGPQLARDDFLLHEAGHLLGLARRPEETAGYHCLNKDCLMNATLRQHIGRQILGQDPILQHRLCEQCVAELVKSSSQSPAGNLRFVGPVLVRSEAGYHVLSLPSRMELLVGNLSERRCRNFAAAVRKETPPPGMDGNAFHYELLMNKAENPDPAKLQEVINRAKADPYVMVRKAAARLEELVNSK